jgi:transcriptional regulator with XRE-family HTH domain
MSRLSPPLTLFGRRLREARLSTGMRQDRLGTMLGFDERSSSARMSRYETGTNEPSFSIIEKLAELLGVPMAYFLCEDDQLAELVLRFAAQDAAGRARLLAMAAQLSAESSRASPE